MKNITTIKKTALASKTAFASKALLFGLGLSARKNRLLSFCWLDKQPDKQPDGVFANLRCY